MNCGYGNRPNEPWPLCVLWPLNWYNKVIALQQTVTGEIGGSCDVAVEDSGRLRRHQLSSGSYRYFEWSKCHHFQGRTASWRWRQNYISKLRAPPIHRNIPYGLNLNLIILLVIQIVSKLWQWTAYLHTYKASSSEVLIAIWSGLFARKRKWWSVICYVRHMC